MSFREFANAELVEQEVHPQTNSQIYFLNGGRSFDDMQVIDDALATGKSVPVSDRAIRRILHLPGADISNRIL